MWKHIKNEHESKNPQDITFNWKVSGKLRKPLERQMTEAVNIARAKPNEVLNSKTEYNFHSIKRLKIQNNSQDFQCFECSGKFKMKNELKIHYEVNHVRIKFCMRKDNLFRHRWHVLCSQGSIITAVAEP